jgi:hypothetical protein
MSGKIEHIIKWADSAVPEWGKQYMRPAFEGDRDAAFSLMCACHDHQRADIVTALWALRVPLRLSRWLSRSQWGKHIIIAMFVRLPGAGHGSSDGVDMPNSTFPATCQKMLKYIVASEIAASKLRCAGCLGLLNSMWLHGLQQGGRRPTHS